MLTEERKTQLDGIVGLMSEKGESDSTIQFVVDDFKTKYTDEPTPKAEGPKGFLGGLSNFAGTTKLGQGIATAIDSGRAGKQLEDTQAQQFDTQNQLLQRIKEKKGRGEDTSRLEKALGFINEDIQATGEGAEQALNPFELTNKQVIGSAIQTGASIIGAGSLAGKTSKVVGAKTFGQGLKIGAKEGIKTGASFGAVTGGAQALQDDSSAEGVLKGIAMGGVIGGVTGGVLGAVGGGISGKLAQKTASKKNFVRDLVTPELGKKDNISAIKTGKVKEATSLAGKRDITGTVRNIDDIERQVQKVPGISADNTHLMNANLVHKEIGNVANSLEQQLKGKGSFTPKEFDKYFKGVKNEIADNPLLVGDAQATATKILSRFEKLVKENGYTPEGLLKARKQLDSWIKSLKGESVFDPKTENALSIALRGIRQGGNDFLAQRVPDVAVKDLLTQQSNLYDAIETIAPKAAKEGENAFKRWVKSNPGKVKIVKYGSTAVGAGWLGSEVF